MAEARGPGAELTGSEWGREFTGARHDRLIVRHRPDAHDTHPIGPAPASTSGLQRHFDDKPSQPSAVTPEPSRPDRWRKPEGPVGGRLQVPRPEDTEYSGGPESAGRSPRSARAMPAADLRPVLTSRKEGLLGSPARCQNFQGNSPICRSSPTG